MTEPYTVLGYSRNQLEWWNKKLSLDIRDLDSGTNKEYNHTISKKGAIVFKHCNEEFQKFGVTPSNEFRFIMLDLFPKTDKTETFWTPILRKEYQPLLESETEWLNAKFNLDIQLSQT